MEMVLIYNIRYFKNFKKYLGNKSQSQSVDFDPDFDFMKIREEKCEIIL